MDSSLSNMYPSSGKVTTLEELNNFLNAVGGFHDGIIKEIHWVNRDYVGSNLCMRPYTYSLATILVQRQWKNPSAVLITFDRLHSCSLDTNDFVFGSDCNQSDVWLVLNIELSTFKFNSFTYEFKSDWMGEEVRLGSEESPATLASRKQLDSDLYRT